MRPGSFPTGTTVVQTGRAVDRAVLTRLRTATATAHERVENRLFPSALADRASYARMLAALLALHEPLERRFARTPGFADLGVDLPSRRKAGALRADLAALGAPAGPAEDLPAGPAPDGLAGAVGAFYVLEGSTLGGRYLLDEVHNRLDGAPSRFFAGYGDDTGRRWRGTRRAIVEVVARDADPADAERRLVDGALGTFAHLDTLLTRAGWAPA